MMHTREKNNPNFSDMATGLELTTALWNTIFLTILHSTLYISKSDQMQEV